MSTYSSIITDAGVSYAQAIISFSKANDSKEVPGSILAEVQEIENQIPDLYKAKGNNSDHVSFRAKFSKFLNKELDLYETAEATQLAGAKVIELIKKSATLYNAFKKQDNRFLAIKKHIGHIGMSAERFDSLHVATRQSTLDLSFQKKIDTISENNSEINTRMKKLKGVLNRAYYALKVAKGEKTFGDNIPSKSYFYFDAARKERRKAAEERPLSPKIREEEPSAPKTSYVSFDKGDTYAKILDSADATYKDTLELTEKFSERENVVSLIKIQVDEVISQKTEFEKTSKGSLEHKNAKKTFIQFMNKQLDQYRKTLKAKESAQQAIVALQQVYTTCTEFTLSEGELSELKQHLSLIGMTSGEFTRKHLAAVSLIKEFGFETKIKQLTTDEKAMAVQISTLKQTLNTAFYTKRASEGKTSSIDLLPSTGHRYLDLELQEEKENKSPEEQIAKLRELLPLAAVECSEVDNTTPEPSPVESDLQN